MYNLALLASCNCYKQCLLLTLLWCSGISEPLPVAATFYMPDASGTSMESYARIDTMVCSVIAGTSVNSKLIQGLAQQTCEAKLCTYLAKAPPPMFLCR